MVLHSLAIVKSLNKYMHASKTLLVIRVLHVNKLLTDQFVMSKGHFTSLHRNIQSKGFHFAAISHYGGRGRGRKSPTPSPANRCQVSHTENVPRQGLDLGTFSGP